MGTKTKKLDAFKLAARRYGTLWAATQARALGVSFDEAYVAFFGRLPSNPRKELK